jgi:hypothetical protein
MLPMELLVVVAAVLKTAVIPNEQLKACLWFLMQYFLFVFNLLNWLRDERICICFQSKFTWESKTEFQVS